MTLKISRVLLNNLRGYRKLDLDDLSNLVIIVGPNAIGKTNIIEAIQVLTTGVSFRKPGLEEIISWGQGQGYALIELKDEKRSLEHRIVVNTEHKHFEVNGKKKSASSIRSSLPCVLFIPDDLQLVKASSVRRRDALDSLAMQLANNYSSLKKDYQHALQQRNLLIKEGVHSGDLFDSWDESLALHGARLGLTRWRLFDRLFNHMTEVHSQIASQERLESLYIPSWNRIERRSEQIGDIDSYEDNVQAASLTIDEVKDVLLHHSHQHAEQELQRGISLIGPHKDEMMFFINGKNARLFASQGQQRTIVLAMKIASVMLINEIMGTEPVLLLDDVMSELDEHHRESLTKFIKKSTQTFITTTNLDYFTPQLLENATIIHVADEGERYTYE